MRRTIIIKTIAITLFAVLFLVLLQHPIRGAIYELRLNQAISGLEIEEARKDQLRAVAGRLGDGFKGAEFTVQERLTLNDLRADLATRRGEALPPREVDLVIGRFEAILQRHGL